MSKEVRHIDNFKNFSKNKIRIEIIREIDNELCVRNIVLIPNRSRQIYFDS